MTMRRHPWVCEFCFALLWADRLPANWQFIWQSAICPECWPKVQRDGGIAVVKGGAYATTPDPRPFPRDFMAEEPR
jgi:hypothetical protein